MAGFLQLRSAAHHFADSFCSRTNLVDDASLGRPSFMGYMITLSEEHHVSELRIDILTGETEPSALRTPAMLTVVEYYREWWPKLLARHDVPFDRIRQTKLHLTLDMPRRSRSSVFRNEVPYMCEVEVLDDMGVVRRGRVSDAWPVK